MIELGKIQKLKVIKTTSIGVFLNDSDTNENAILLPKKQVPAFVDVGDEVEVFVYRDSKDRIIATTNRPKITIGELAALKVVEITSIGAFLDWGLEKDLFLPFTEQKGKVRKGKKYVVGLYVDKSNRLCATMDISKMISTDSPYKKDDWVEGIIYRIVPEIEAFIAVDGKYEGLIPKQEFIGKYYIGDKVKVRVSNIKEDGKLDLSLKEKAYKQIDEDALFILSELERKGGKLYMNDKSDPGQIKKELNMSKGAFKRAVGRLMKEKKIKQTDEGIELL